MASGCTVLVGTGTTGGAAKHAPHTANRAHDKVHHFAVRGGWFNRDFANSRRGMIPPMSQDPRGKQIVISKAKDVLVYT